MSYYLSTIRHLTAAQLWYRSKRIIRGTWWRLSARHSPQPTQCKLAPHAPLYRGLPEITGTNSWTDEIADAIERAREAGDNKFCFLNHRVEFDDDLRWNDPELSQLWRYHLHYFDFVSDLLVLAASGESELAHDFFRRLALSWIDDNQTLSGDGWHPYTISLRVVNWLHAVRFFSEKIPADEASDTILRSLYGQVQVLSSNLELDVRGNHLLENLRSLIWAGIAFEGDEPQRWLEGGLRLLEKEVTEQILSDGGHFERSPGYHLVVLKDLLEISIWLKRNQGAAPPWLEAALERMREYLWTILTPHEDIPLLKDSARDVAPHPLDMLAACAVYFDEPSHKYREDFGLYPLLLFGLEGWEKFKNWPANTTPRASAPLPASGHYILRDEHYRDYLIFDAGKPCPDYLPAHAHADLLSYELSCEGERVIVDSGVYEYQAGPWRDFFRSTRAHNTVEIAGENQSEVWSSFRVGRRARPNSVTWRAQRDYVLVQAEHDGYLRLPVPVIHQRTIVWRERSFWLVVDQLWGKGSTSAASHLHFSPDLFLEPIDSTTWRIKQAESFLWLSTFGAQSQVLSKGQTEPVRQGWYSERFGIVEPNTVLTLHQKGPLAQCYGYVFAREESAEVDMTKVATGHEINVTHRGQTQTLRLIRGALPEFE